MAEIIASTYEIIEKIGMGGGGVVYLAKHLRLEKKVILKADKRKLTTKPEHLRREVDILKELSHPYIPQVYDFFIYGNTVYTAMEYIEGESLDKSLKRGERFSQPQIILWAKQLLTALDYLHSPIHGDPPRGYVHSDIKPANIMRTLYGNISLIDFNIARAVGEESIVGCSPGYASPEHYGLDFSTDSKSNITSTSDFESSSLSVGPLTKERRKRELGADGNLIEILPESEEKVCVSFFSGLRNKRIIPDVRSDIYSLGATLYHLLSGSKPAKDAKDVVPLSKKEFSAQLVNIITKAMNPNPDLRYQSAKEMLDALKNLHRNDVRSVRWRRRNRFVYVVLALFLVSGVACSFIGLRRMQTSERWLRLTEDAQNLLQAGNRAQALQCVKQVYDEQQNGLLFPQTMPRTQEVLTEILGVYDVADEFRIHKTLQLPSAPLDIHIAPDASTALCLCFGKLIIADLNTGEILDSLETENSALAEAAYIDEHTIVYAGADGLTAYDLLQERELWKGEKATNVVVSGNGGTVAAVYKDNTHAEVYDAETGKQKRKVDFAKKHQSVAPNDIFINTFDNLFCLNQVGDLLAVSFSDGSLMIKDLNETDNDIEIFDDTVPYTHYEGGFYQQYLAFSATTGKQEESVFAVIDTDAVVQTGGFSSEGYYFAAADENGIIVGLDNILQRMDPVTGDAKPLVNTKETITRYSCDGAYTMISSGGHVYFFDEDARESGTFENNFSCDLLALQNNTAVVGSLNSPEVWILKYENHPENQILAYDPEYVHDEARLSADGDTVMLFSYNKFRIYDVEGNVVRDVSVPDAAEVYDQQYIREGEDSYLDVLYRDGKLDRYDAEDGELIKTQKTDPPDMTLYEEFETDHLRIESPLHGSRKVYRKDTGELAAELSDDAYLTYLTEAGDYLVAQYVTTDSRFYGYLMDQNCQILAYLPNLCDVLPGELLFDYPSGDIRKVKIYEITELLDMAREEIEDA